jgi:hypothetical protein
VRSDDTDLQAEKQPARGDALERAWLNAHPGFLEAIDHWALVYSVLEPAPKPKHTRKPSLTTRVKAVRRAGAEAEIKPDGTIVTKHAAEAERANGDAGVNPWDEVPNYGEDR